MKHLKHIEPIANHQLVCLFDDGTKKIADLTAFLKTPAFEPLKNENNFKKITNHFYFIEWKDFEIDLSADTLWHVGKDLPIF